MRRSSKAKSYILHEALDNYLLPDQELNIITMFINNVSEKTSSRKRPRQDKIHANTYNKKNDEALNNPH